VVKQTFLHGLRFVAGLSIFFAADFAVRAESIGPTLHVAVHNDASVAEMTVAAAESAAGKVFATAGLQIDWMNCGRRDETDAEARRCSKASYPTYLQLRILSRPRHRNGSTLGISYLGADGKGCYSEIFAARVQDLGVGSEVRSVILGHVMAHELAHLLLGTNSHAESGIMRAQWLAAELTSASKADLFSARQAQIMRQTLSAGMNRQALQNRDGNEVVRPALSSP
jgi:hypothetical protein